MTYDEFKDYLLDFLWKRGDSIVIDRLDTLIRTAESELNRTLKLEDRTQLSDTQAIDNLVQLPPDYRQMRVLSNPHCREMKYTIPTKFFNMARRFRNNVNLEAYTIVNNNIALLGPITPEKPLDLTLMYYMNIPNFKEAGISWLADNYLDIYTYCVLKHSAPFLREDERIPTWQAMFGEAIASAMAENDDRKYAGSPIQIHFPSGVR